MKVHYSSKKQDWKTPPEIFEPLNKEFKFTLDPCADDLNHKCERYFTIEDDGLAQDWGKHIVFMNPPYGREIGKWVKKAYDSSQSGATVVCLLPARTDTKWWHEYIMKGEIRFIKGRIKFLPINMSAPFPSAIVIFRGGL